MTRELAPEIRGRLRATWAAAALGRLLRRWAARGPGAAQIDGPGQAVAAVGGQGAVGRLLRRWAARGPRGRTD